MKKILPLLFIFGLLACEKEDSIKSYNGILVDSGLGGCGWMIESNGTRFELTNLSDFSIPLTDSLAVKFTYTHPDTKVSICMGGPAIKLLSINKK